MKTTQYAAIAACLAFALSGCGSSAASDAAGTGTGGQQGSEATGQSGGGRGVGGQGGSGGGRGSGKVAAVSGSTAQVQNQSEQVAVTWTAKTTFARQVVTKAAALKVGDCVVALPAQSDAAAQDDSSDSGTADAPVTAATVRITAPVNGSCSRGTRAGGGTPPSGAPSGASGRGEGQSGSGVRGGRPGGFGAFGQVTAISGSGFTVESQVPDSSAASSSGTPSTTAVTTSAATTWSTTEKATAKAVTVGQCVTSLGQAGATGAVAAVSITVSAPVDGACTTGFGGPGTGGQNR